MPEAIIYQLILIPLLIAVNAFFVAAEMGLARSRKTRIEQLAFEGSKLAELALKSLKDPDRFISACQLGITLSTLGLGAVGEQTFASDLSRWMMQLGLDAHWQPAVTSAAQLSFYVLAFAVTAFVQTVFGELIPKTLTYRRAEPVFLSLIWPIECWCWLTAPFIVSLNSSTSLILRLFKVKDPPRRYFVHTEEELKMLVSASHQEGVLEEEEQEMLHSVFDFSDTEANQVMTPRTDMICLPAEATIQEFVDLALKHGHSRLPIFDGDIDSIFGAVHIRDALRALVEKKADSKVRELARKVLIVPENKNAGDLLTEFKKTKTHMAIVVDEYGGTRGLVTIEDLIEELVGDIADEHEIVEEFIQAQEDGSMMLDAKLSLDEANEQLGLQIQDEQFNTLGGHVFGQLGREPKVGDEVGSDAYTLRVEESDRHRIIKLRLLRQPFQASESDTDGGGTTDRADDPGIDAERSVQRSG